MRRRDMGIRAETPVDSTLPLLEAAALEAGIGGSTVLGTELEARGYFEAGLLEQWQLVEQVLWEHVEAQADLEVLLGRLAVHPEPLLRCRVPALYARAWEGQAEAGLARLRVMAEDEDFRVAESLQAFGVRPFAQAEGPAVVELLQPWVADPLPQVRRAAVQAVRPRGFWVKRLEWAHESPGLLLPLLEKLRDEDQRFPANAVANCFNDISRVRPELALAVLGRWLEEGRGMQVEHVARKALRSLIKDGDPRALALFGLGELPVEVKARLLGGEVVPPNSALEFRLAVENRGADATAQLVYELSTTGRVTGRPRRKRYQGGDHLLPGGKTTVLRVRERIFDRKAAMLIDGPGEGRFWINGAEVAVVPFEVRR